MPLLNAMQARVATTELRKLFGLREAATTTAIDIASRDRDAAWRSVQASGAEMLVVVAALCGLTHGPRAIGGLRHRACLEGRHAGSKRGRSRHQDLGAGPDACILVNG